MARSKKPRARIAETKDYILIEASGNIDSSYVQDGYRRTKKIVEKRRKSNKPVKLLGDMSKVKKETSGARIQGVKLLRLDFDAVAIVGVSNQLRAAIIYVLRSAGVTDKSKFFKTKKEAVEWLRRDPRSFKSLQPKRLIISLAIALPLIFVVALWQIFRQDLHSSIESKQSEFSSAVQTSLNDRLGIFINQQHAFASLLKTGDIDGVEFNNFYESLNLTKRYPGFYAISYVRYVPAGRLDNFVASQSKDPLYKKLHKKFKVKKSSRDFYAPVVYAEPISRSVGYGIDLSSSIERRENFINARDTGHEQYSKSIEIITPKATVAKKTGFLITLPIYNGPSKTKAQKQENIVGFINAVFSFDQFLPSVINHSSQDSKDVNIKVFYDDKQVYQSPNINKVGTDKRIINTKLGARNLRMEFLYPPNYGVSSIERAIPVLILASGVFIWILIVVIMQNSAKKRSLAADMAESITEDLRNERDYAISLQDRDEAILNSIGDGLVTTDKEGYITSINKSFTDILGFKASSVIGEKFTDILIMYNPNGDEIDLVNRPLTRAIKERKSTEVRLSDNYFYKKKDGALIPVAINITPIFSKSGFEGAVEIFRDISLEKEVDKAKTEFVSLASHQLRTPLSTINWYSEMLLSGDAGTLNDEQMKYLGEISEGNRRMTQLVDDLLNTSRIDLGTFRVEPEPTDIVKLSKQIIKDIEPNIFQRQIKFEEKYAKNIPNINIDPRLTTMVIENLCSNAIKYTPKKGNVKFEVSKKKDRILITVSDNGYGIPKSQQDRVFSKLFRAENIQAEDTEGSGLGLYLVKSIIDYSGGKIWLESKEGKGSTFFVELPISGMKAKKA